VISPIWANLGFSRQRRSYQVLKKILECILFAISARLQARYAGFFSAGLPKKRRFIFTRSSHCYYAIDSQGNTLLSNAAMAARAAIDCLDKGQMALKHISLLASGSSGGDAIMPGLANMIQGQLAAQPLETLSVHGICVAGVGALQAVAQGIELDLPVKCLHVCSSAHGLPRAITTLILTRIFYAGCSLMALERYCLGDGKHLEIC